MQMDLLFCPHTTGPNPQSFFFSTKTTVFLYIISCGVFTSARSAALTSAPEFINAMLAAFLRRRRVITM